MRRERRVVGGDVLPDSTGGVLRLLLPPRDPLLLLPPLLGTFLRDLLLALPHFLLLLLLLLHLMPPEFLLPSRVELGIHEWRVRTVRSGDGGPVEREIRAIPGGCARCLPRSCDRGLFALGRTGRRPSPLLFLLTKSVLPLPLPAIRLFRHTPPRLVFYRASPVLVLLCCPPLRLSLGLGLPGLLFPGLYLLLGVVRIRIPRVVLVVPLLVERDKFRLEEAKII